MGSDDLIYLADRGAHMALELTLAGEVLLELGNRGQPSDTGCTEDEGEVLRSAGPFNRPTRMSPSPGGDLYVSDGYRNSRVHRFSAEGRLIASWGEPGNHVPGEFHSPHSLWIDKDGLIYVCDRRNNRIQIFEATGDFLTQWTDLQLPTDLHTRRSVTRSIPTMYGTFIHTDRLASLLHRALDSGGGQHRGVLLALRKIASTIGSRGCRSDDRRADPVKYGRSHVKTDGAVYGWDDLDPGGSQGAEKIAVGPHPEHAR